MLDIDRCRRAVCCYPCLLSRMLAMIKTDRPWTLVSATRNLAEAGVVIPRALLESVTARIARTMKDFRRLECKSKGLLATTSGAGGRREQPFALTFGHLGLIRRPRRTSPPSDVGTECTTTNCTSFLGRSQHQLSTTKSPSPFGAARLQQSTVHVYFHGFWLTHTHKPIAGRSGIGAPRACRLVQKPYRLKVEGWEAVAGKG